MCELRAPGMKMWKPSTLQQKEPRRTNRRDHFCLIGEVLSGRNIGRGGVLFICAGSDVDIALFERRIVSIGESSVSKGPMCRDKFPCEAASYLLAPSHRSALLEMRQHRRYCPFDADLENPPKHDNPSNAD
jgi:hypothetical protein